MSASGTNPVTTDYTYDRTDQLKTVNDDTDNSLDRTYNHDENGNRTSVVNNTTESTYTQHSAGYNRLGGDGTYTYSYDLEGNLRSRTDGSGQTSFTWDHRNRLTGIFTTGEQAHWRFDGNAEDSTANNLDGTPQYDATFSTAGAPIVGNAGSLSLDGAQDYLLVGDVEKLKLRDKDLSLSIWFKPDVNSVMQLITQGNVWASGGQGYDLSYHGGDSPKTIEFRVNDGSGSYQAVTETLSSGLSGAWHHVAVTVDRDGDVVIYLDGAEVERAAFNQTANSDIQGSVAFVGGGHDGGTWTFDGLLDDMRVYRGSGVLSAADVTKLYTSSDSLPALPSVGAKRVYYTYDALDRRIRKEIDANGDGDVDEASQYVYDGRDIIFAADGASSLTNRYLYGPAVDQVFADEDVNISTSSDNRVRWPLTDHLGSVRDLVDNAGNVDNRITYDAFGQITSESDGTVKHIYGFTAQERDYESDFDYYNARYYIPALGRWISEDPLSFAAGDGNLHRYTGNSPTQGDCAKLGSLA